VTQKSFSSSALSPATNPGLPGAAATIPIGANGPLVGARPFRRPPHTIYIALDYAYRKWTQGLNVAMASRSDDSTYLGGDDLAGGNSLLLPNRNLDFGYAKVNVNEAYAVTPRLSVFMQIDNLLNQQHIAPIGYPSMPATVRFGLKARFGGN